MRNVKGDCWDRAMRWLHTLYEQNMVETHLYSSVINCSNRGKYFSVKNPLYVWIELYKEQKRGRNETTKIVEKGHKKSTLYTSIQLTIKCMEQMWCNLILSLLRHLSDFISALFLFSLHLHFYMQRIFYRKKIFP